MLRALSVLLLVGVLTGPGPAEVRRSPFAGDSRLERPVTVRWKKTPLREVMQELSRATGVRLVPDRKIVDEPVMAAATGIPARVLLEQLGRLLRFTWARSGGTAAAPNYRFFQDRRAQQEEEALIHHARRQVVQALQQQLARCRQVSRLPPDELERQRAAADRTLAATAFGDLNQLSAAEVRRMEDARTFRDAASPIGQAMVQLLDGLTPEHWRQLEVGTSLRFSSRPDADTVPLPPALADRLRAARPELGPAPPEAAEGFARAERRMQEQWSRARDFQVTVTLNLSLDSGPAGILRAAPEPVDTEGPGRSVGLGLSLMGAPELLDVPEEDPAEREKRLAADPLLGKKALLTLPPLKKGPDPPATESGYPTAEVLPAVAQAYGIKLVGDAYTRLAFVRLTLTPGEIRLYRVLDQITGTTRTWEREGDTIRLRSRHWAHHRRAEIPVRDVRRWLDLRKKQGGFTLDDLAGIATTLRDEQVEALPLSAREAGVANASDFHELRRNQGILRFYGQLVPLQRRRLHAGQPLAMRTLAPSQQAALVNAHREQNRTLIAVVRGAQPARSADRWAQAVLSLENKELAAPGLRAEAESPAGALAELTAPRVSYTFHVAFSDGQKDSYSIRLTRLTPAGF